MRFALFLCFLVACALSIGFGVFGTSATSSILGAIWTLIAVVAMGFRAVLDALRAREGSGAEPRGEPGDRGGARMPSWLGSSDAGQQ